LSNNTRGQHGVGKKLYIQNALIYFFESESQNGGETRDQQASY
jgi:hypothetical protein